MTLVSGLAEIQLDTQMGRTSMLLILFRTIKILLEKEHAPHKKELAHCWSARRNAKLVA